ncbi:hypothetical protein E2C01_050990 [Portunus trituberculatus]|uniref:Uncharacterized protein n=1 Tax=Portunus trituberculatus TaxID=210409 RepID=A0A5B7GDK4_PORTR|nr:hypothetical protein [Portunus trituberculatus]
MFGISPNSQKYEIAKLMDSSPGWLVKGEKSQSWW